MNFIDEIIYIWQYGYSLRGKFFIVLITFGWISTAWGALQFELTGNRPPVNAFGIASINDKGVVFSLKPGQADYTRHRWSEFSLKGLETLLAQLPAERAFLQKDARTRLLLLDFIRAGIIAQSRRPAQVPVVQPAQDSKKNPSQGETDENQKNEFNLVPGPAILAPPASRLSPINWLNPGGLFILLLLSGLSAYSGHEIAVFRHRPVKIICTLSALIPVIVPLIVLFLPDPAEAHAQAVAEANDQFLIGAAPVSGAAAEDHKMLTDETRIEGIDGSVVMERYQNTEIHFSDQFFSEYFSRFYQASPAPGQSLVIQTPEVIYPVHHISRLELESLSVVYAQGLEWVEESIDYRLIEEVRVEASVS